MSAANPTAIERVAKRLGPLRRVCCLTGAGVSAESGVPTFRGAGGFWQGQRAEDLATPQAFERDPQHVWRFYNYRRNLLRDCKPNPAHHAISECDSLFDEFTVITQNVDGLHRLAGSRHIVELHGSIWTVRCLGCGQEFDKFAVELPELPTCEDCGAMLRPAVVWFGETLPAAALASAERAIESCEAMLVIGTSSVVQPAASMAGWAKAGGALVVEINLESTALSSEADDCLCGRAGEIMPALLAKIRESAHQE